MLTVNVTSIRNHSAELRSLLGDYETTSMSIAQEVKNLETEWHDDNSGSFFALEETQKVEIAKLVSSIETICNKYDQIANETVAIDSSIHKVFCDQSVRGKVKTKYDNAINKVTSLVNSLNNCSTYFCTSGERSAINSARNSLSRAQKKLQDSSAKVERYFDQLTALESSINTLLSGITVSIPSELDLSQFLRL